VEVAWQMEYPSAPHEKRLEEETASVGDRKKRPQTAHGV